MTRSEPGERPRGQGSRGRASAALALTIAALGCAQETGPEGAAAAPTTPTTGPAPVEPPAPAPTAPGRRLTLAPRTLAPGDEKERCTILAATDASARIHRIEMRGTPGLHHAIVYAGRGPFEEGEVDCFGLPEGSMDMKSFPSLIFAGSTQVQRQSFRMPEGVAVELAGVTHFIVNHHFLNATSAPLEASVEVDLHALPPDVPSTPARSFSFGAVAGIDVPARGSQRLSTTCTFAQSVNVVSLTPHMHRAGTEFSVRRHDGQAPAETLSSTTDWSNPETTTLSPALPLTPGQGLTFTCAWTNGTDTPLRFGPLASDEMCFVFGYYYPATTDLLQLDVTGCQRE